MECCLTDYLNADIDFPQAFYSLGANEKSPPEMIHVVIKAKFSPGWVKDILLPLEKLSITALKKECPFLGCKLENRKADHLLMNALQSAFETGSVSVGYVFHELGALQFPDGSLRFLRGEELIPENCSRPWTLAPEIAGIELAGNGTSSADEITSTLLSVPPQALLSIAYTDLTSVRSVVLDNGVDFQAVCYIVGGQGLGKTTLAKRTAGIYRNKQAGKPAGIVQASSTISAVGQLLVSLRDQPVVIDDLCLSAGRDTERKRRELGAYLMRKGTGEEPIIKQSGEQTLELYCNAGVCLTAEFSMKNASDLDRCIIIPVDQRLNLPSNFTPELVGDILRIYSAWFAQNHERAIKRLRTDLNSDWWKDKIPRIRTNYGCVRWAFQCMLDALEDCGYLSSENHMKLLKRLENALNIALDKHLMLKQELMEQIPAGNLAAILYSGYKNRDFDLVKKPKKLKQHEGIIWQDDLCLRSEALVRFIRIQPGFHGWSRNRITQELKDMGALVLQEENASTVRLAEGLPRVYRIRLSVLKDATEWYPKT